jgi:hypothetical protein
VERHWPHTKKACTKNKENEIGNSCFSKTKSKRTKKEWAEKKKGRRRRRRKRGCRVFRISTKVFNII